MAEEKTTIKLSVDTADLKKGIQDANRQIRLANAEFKAASAGMDSWGKSTDGVEAKLKQLKSVLGSQKTILESYKTQLQKVVEEQGENSKGADELRIKIANQEAAVNKTEKEIRNYSAALEQLKTDEKNTADEAGVQGNAFDDLKKKIADQESELTKLKNTYSATVLEQGKDSEAAKSLATQIDSLSGELKDNKSELDRAKNSADSLDQTLEETEKDTKKTNDGFTVMKGSLADLASKGISKVIQGMKDLAKEAYNSWKEYDQGLDNIIKKTGATGDATEDFKKVYNNISQRVVAPMSDIGNAVGEVATRFDTSGKDLESLSEKFLKFSQLNNTDVSSSIDTVQQAMAAWGIGTKDAGKVLDLLNAAGQQTGISVTTLSGALSSNAAALQEMGYSASDAALFVASLEKNGVDTSSTLTGMKKALINAAKEGKPMSEAMADIEKEIKNAGNSTEAMSKASELFGARSAPAVVAAIRDGRLSFKELGSSMDDFAGNVESTFEETKDAPYELQLGIQKVKNKLGETAGELLNKYKPQIEDFLNTLINNIIPKIEAGAEFFINNLPLIEAGIVGITTALIAFKAASAIGAIITAWQTYAAATEGATVAQWLLNVAMAANPVGLLVAAIIGLIAVIVVLWNKSDEFRGFWIGLWEKLKEVVGIAIGKIQTVISKIFDFFKNNWQNILLFMTNPFAAFFKYAYENLNSFKEKVDSVVNAVKSVFSSMWSTLKTKAKEAWEGIKETFSTVAEFFQKTFSNAWQKVKDVFSTGGKIFDGIKEGIVDSFKNIVNSIIRGINKIIKIPFDELNRKLNAIRSIKIGNIKPFEKLWGENPLQVPKIQELERGGVLKKGQMGLLEGNGAEAVVPLDKNRMWIAQTARELSGAMNKEGIATASSVTNNYNFNQTNNSPKALNRLEIYRMTKKQINLAKGVL